jgi:hypothetical protein
VQVTAVDWKNVLAVAEEHARAAGVAERFRTIPGSAFDVPFGEGFDLVCCRTSSTTSIRPPASRSSRSRAPRSRPAGAS